MVAAGADLAPGLKARAQLEPPIARDFTVEDLAVAARAGVVATVVVGERKAVFGTNARRCYRLAQEMA